MIPLLAFHPRYCSKCERLHPKMTPCPSAAKLVGPCLRCGSWDIEDATEDIDLEPMYGCRACGLVANATA